MSQFTDIQTYRRWGAVIFLKTHELYGGLSNMAAGYPLVINGARILTSEALYQACRFPHRPEVQKLIIEQASPMAAKMKSKPYRKDSRPDWEQVNVDIMRWCLRVKLAQNWERFGELLRSTGERPIIEESKRDAFWGAKPTDATTLAGRNVLGRLLMELRDQLRGPDAEALRTVQPLPLPDFLFLGQPIGVLERPASSPGAASARTVQPATQLTLETYAATTAGSAQPAAPLPPTAHTTLKQEPTMQPTTQPRKKLIEVALPLEAINKESAREKSIRHGHPSTLHLWWSRKPLATARAVLFAQLVDDPASCPEEFPSEAAQNAERQRLFDIIEDLVKWENSTNEALLHQARTEIARSAARAYGVRLPHRMTPDEVAEALSKYAPPVLDPFAGGGSIPLEAQRLGLEAHASDLNPVAVLINKALIEIPPKFANRPPVHPVDNPALLQREWRGAQGLAEDVRYYGKWMRDEAWKRIGHLYPKVKLPKEQGGSEATVIAWLWARTVKCPNPACGAQMPLTSKWTLSTKQDKEAWVEPMIDQGTKTVRFAVRQGSPSAEQAKVIKNGTKTGRGANFACLICGATPADSYIKDEGMQKRLGAVMLAVVVEGSRGRAYLSPQIIPYPPSEEELDLTGLTAELADDPRNIWCKQYGLNTYADLFTPRQLTALTTFSDLVSEAREQVLRDMGLTPGPSPLRWRGEQEGTSAASAHPTTDPRGQAIPPLHLRMERGPGGEARRAPRGQAIPPLHPQMERGLRGEARRALCRELRQKQTPAEQFFWELVRDRRFEGYKFRRQHPLGTFITDFYCPELRLAVELDGGIHATQVERDQARDEILAQQGIRVVRIRNEELVADPEATLARLSDLIAGWTASPRPSPASPEREPEGEAASPSPSKMERGPGGEAAPTPTQANAQAYADAVATYLALAVDKVADYCSSICSWHSGRDTIRNTFARQAIAMTWDFAEANPLSDSTGNFQGAVDWIFEVIQEIPAAIPGQGKQSDATTAVNGNDTLLISTDPPYYDNIGYADLSDYFYVWLRRSLGKVYPNLFSTLLVPKAQELIATPYRFGGDKKKAQAFFEEGLEKTFSRMREAQQPGYPLTVYYAFKQAESEDDEHGQANGSVVSASTGWETMLEGLLKAGFAITGTWPIRTEMVNRSVGLGTNALASSIVLVCRPRQVDAPLTSRGEFLRALKRELPAALKDLQRGHIAPVDLAQAAIGPGMAVFSRYSKVLEADGSAMRVRTALQLINQALDEVLVEQEGEYDAETRWVVAWFEEYGMEEGPYGKAETLSKAKNIALERLVEAGILSARGGKVRLLRREELADGWNPARQPRLTAWEVTQRLIKALETAGEQGAAAVLDGVGGLGEVARDLAYRLYTTCERKGWAQEALAYNSLIVDWRDIAGQAGRLPVAEQAKLL